MSIFTPSSTPFGVVSDIHCHTWSLFSSTEKDGMNSRLRIILDEWMRAAREIVKVGGHDMICCGDIFHVRGSLDPEVLNPVQNTVRDILDMGVSITAIPGNHDLKGKETTEIGSAIQNLCEVFSDQGQFTVINEPKLVQLSGHTMGFVPWQSSKDELLRSLRQLAAAVGSDKDQMDVFIHAGIDGVLPGVPPHGLTDVEIADIGFRRVFAGDYHNHKIMQGGKVISVGASTHQTWRDVGSKAGFLLCTDTEVKFMDTHAPKFIDLTGQDEDDMRLLSDGNYVRFRGGQMTAEEVKELRDFFTKSGALGTSLQVPIAATTQRTGISPVKAGQTLDQSVTGYADKMELKPEVDRDLVKRKAAETLAKARAVYEDS